jgi:hypothetical protein
MTITRLFYGLSLLFFWLMLVIPTTHQAERSALLGFLLFAGLIHALRDGNWKLNSEVAFVGLSCISASIFFMLIGALNGNPVLKISTVYVIWPLLYIFIMGLYWRPEHWAPFFKILIIGSISTAMIGVLAVLETLGFFNVGFVTLLGTGVRVDVSGNSIAYSMPNLVTVMYAFPFFVALLLLPTKLTQIKGAWLKIAWLGLVLSVLVLLVSGRRAFWVVAVLSPFIAIYLSTLCKIKINWKNFNIFVIIIVILLVAVISYSNVDINIFWDNFMRGFAFSDSSNGDAYTRKEQFLALFNGWTSSPLIGFGHGGGAEEYIRSDKEPWSYELSYTALLFHTGLVGFFIYGGAVVWLFVRSISVVRRQPEAALMLIPLLTGLLCFLIANTSNPYLEKFDYLWTLFLPTAILNAYLLRNKKGMVQPQ